MNPNFRLSGTIEVLEATARDVEFYAHKYEGNLVLWLLRIGMYQNCIIPVMQEPNEHGHVQALQEADWRAMFRGAVRRRESGRSYFRGRVFLGNVPTFGIDVDLREKWWNYGKGIYNLQ